MRMNAYSIFDQKALVYSPPFFQPTHGSATRLLADLANDATTQIGRHPSDFILYCVGLFDDQKGALAPLSPLEHVVDAISLVRFQTALPLDKAAQ